MINIILGALLLSVWATILFFGKNIGLSVLLFVVPFIYILLNILKTKEKIKYKKAIILIVPIILLASTYFIFNNGLLNKLNLLVIPILILILIVELFEKNLKIYSILEKFIEIIFGPISYLDVTMKKCKVAIIERLNFKENNNKNSSIVKAILLTIPIAFLVILLLSTADEVFGKIFIDIFNKIIAFFSNFNLGGIVGRIIFIICLFIYFSAFFDNLVSRYEETKEDLEGNLNLNDNTTVKLLLGVLNLIYIFFCFIQIKSLFMKVNVEDYSYYARKGFFQLMLVSFINFIIILVAKNYKKSKNSKYINVMSLIMIVCTFIILLSAAFRMRMYESAYGYTLLRLLVYVALFTESILLIPTIIYVVDKPINLVKSYFTIILVVYVCLNYANLDNIIMKNNVDRYFEISSIDLPYLKRNTGTDGIKQIKRILETEAKNEEQAQIQIKVREYIKQVHDEISPMDFRDFNISKYRVEKMDILNIKAEKKNDNDKKETNSKTDTSNLNFSNVDILNLEFSEEDLKLEKEYAMTSGERLLKVGNTIIYSGLYNNKIYKIDLKTKDIKILYECETDPHAMYFDGEFVYFMPYYYSGKGIYKLDLQGNCEKIYDGASLKLWVTDNEIYFVEQIGFDDMNQNPQGNLCKMNKDGSGIRTMVYGIRNNFVIYKDKVYFSDLNTKAACVADLDGFNKKELIPGRITIGTVNDKHMTAVDFASSQSMKIYDFETGSVKKIGRFGSFGKYNNSTYIYTRESTDNSDGVEDDFTLFEFDENSNKREIFQDKTVGLNHMLYVYKEYAYFNTGNEFYRINLNSGHKDNIDSYRDYINDKAYLFKQKDQEILSLKIYDLDENVTSEISFEK